MQKDNKLTRRRKIKRQKMSAKHQPRRRNHTTSPNTKQRIPHFDEGHEKTQRDEDEEGAVDRSEQQRIEKNDRPSITSDSRRDYQKHPLDGCV